LIGQQSVHWRKVSHIYADTRKVFDVSIAARIAEFMPTRFKSEPLPDRIQALIQAREEEGERLIGWVQLALVATFAALFYLAPRPVDAGMPIWEPVPVALTAYALFTLLRLGLAYRGHVPWWLLVLSIAIDTALLMTLIWSFHTQYGQPAAFSLKVPTFVYVFVFIAVRGLRFDFRYVLLTGLAMAGGWAIMVWAAIRADGRDVITRNFSDYLTDNRILLGAEFDKIIAILLVSGLLAFTVARAQAMLVIATREEAAGLEMRRFLSEGVAAAITTSDEPVQPGDAMEREAAIVMLDIRGFTRIATALSPREMVELLTRFHARIVPLIQQHNGVIDKFLGDGVMVTFGAVDPSTTAAADALRGLDAIMAEAAIWRQELQQADDTIALELNGAAVAGPVVFATLGHRDRLEFTVIGDAVNLAAKLEKHNKTAGSRAITSQETYALAMAQGYNSVGGARLMPRVNVAGVATPIDLVILA
jgi:adenylate cyclase